METYNNNSGLRRTICLSMIVRNEQETISGCLRSVKSVIDRYAIVDTGSTDETIRYARCSLTNRKGQILRSRWRNDFAWHRNEALHLAQAQLDSKKGGIILFIDADERLLPHQNFKQQEFALHENEVLWAYAADEEYRYLKLLAADAMVCRQWEGRVHEQLSFRKNAAFKIAKHIQLSYGQYGYRRRSPRATQLDITELMQAINRAPGFRSYFFLARTYEVAASFDSAALYFEQAYYHANNHEELFQSMWGSLRSLVSLGREAQACVIATKMLEMTEGRRAEPLLFMARQALSLGRLNEARMFSHVALRCPLPWGSQMYDAGANRWKAYVTLAQSWRHSGRGVKARYYWNKALSCPELSPAIKRRIKMLMTSNQ